MTKQQAIEVLKSLLLNIAGEKDCQAIELAITALQSDPYAPDWSKAPWANYYGIDGDGSRWFYEKKPRVVGLSYDHNTGDFTKDEELGRMKLLKRL